MLFTHINNSTRLFAIELLGPNISSYSQITLTSTQIPLLVLLWFERATTLLPNKAYSLTEGVYYGNDKIWCFYTPTMLAHPTVKTSLLDVVLLSHPNKPY